MEKKSGTPTRSELRKFGYTIGGFFAFFFGLLLPWLFSKPYMHWPWFFGAILCLVSTIYPPLLSSFYRFWMHFANILGWINTRIILGIAFILVFTPTGFLMRLFKKDPLEKKWNSKAQTYRVNASPRKPEHMERQF